MSQAHRHQLEEIEEGKPTTRVGSTRNTRSLPQVSSRSNRFARMLVILIIWLAYTLMLSSAVQKSATVDEQSHLFRGYAYFKTGATQFLLGHPILGGTLSALPLLTESELALPVDDPAT